MPHMHIRGVCVNCTKGLWKLIKMAFFKCDGVRTSGMAYGKFVVFIILMLDNLILNNIVERTQIEYYLLIFYFFVNLRIRMKYLKIGLYKLDLVI